MLRKMRKDDVVNERLPRLTSFAGKAMEEMVLESTAKARKEKKVLGNCECGFRKGKRCLSELRVFCVEVTRFVDEERAVAGV